MSAIVWVVVPRGAPEPEKVEKVMGRTAKRRELWHKQKGLCFWCGQYTPFDQATIEHMLPRSQGGSNRMDNLAMACERCNSKRAGNEGRPLGVVYAGGNPAH